MRIVCPAARGHSAIAWSAQLWTRHVACLLVVLTLNIGYVRMLAAQRHDVSRRTYIVPRQYVSGGVATADAGSC